MVESKRCNRSMKLEEEFHSITFMTLLITWQDISQLILELADKNSLQIVPINMNKKDQSQERQEVENELVVEDL